MQFGQNQQSTGLGFGQQAQPTQGMGFGQQFQNTGLGFGQNKPKTEAFGIAQPQNTGLGLSFGQNNQPMGLGFGQTSQKGITGFGQTQPNIGQNFNQATTSLGSTLAQKPQIQGLGFGQTQQTNNIGFGQNLSKPGLGLNQNTGINLNQAQLFQNDNNFGDKKSPFGAQMGLNTQNQLGFNNQQTSMPGLGMNQQKNQFGLPQNSQLGGMGTMNQMGSFQKEFEVLTNQKNNKVFVITHMPNYTNKTLLKLRLEDYNVFKQNLGNVQSSKPGEFMKGYFMKNSGNMGQMPQAQPFGNNSSFPGGPIGSIFGNKNEPQGTGFNTNPLQTGFNQQNQNSQMPNFGNQQQNPLFSMGSQGQKIGTQNDFSLNKPLGGLANTNSGLNFMNQNQNKSPLFNPGNNNQQFLQTQQGGLGLGFNQIQTGQNNNPLFGNQQTQSTNPLFGTQQGQSNNPLFGTQQTQNNNPLFGNQGIQGSNSTGLFQNQLGVSNQPMQLGQQLGQQQGGLFDQKPNQAFSFGAQPQSQNQPSSFMTFGNQQNQQVQQQPQQQPQSQFSFPAYNQKQQQNQNFPTTQGILQTVLPQLTTLENGGFIISCFPVNPKQSLSKNNDSKTNENAQQKQLEEALRNLTISQPKKQDALFVDYQKLDQKSSICLSEANDLYPPNYRESYSIRDIPITIPVYHHKSNSVKNAKYTSRFKRDITTFKKKMPFELSGALDDTNRVRVTIEYSEGTDNTVRLFVEKFNNDSLIAEIVKFLKEQNKLANEEGSDQFKIYYKGKKLDNLKTFKEIDFQSGDIIYVQNESKKMRQNEQLAYPKLTKEGYFCEPSMDEIKKMSANDLKNVHNFVIWNEFGRIEFIQPVNLLNLNLDDIFGIDQQNVEIYPSDKFPSGIPEKGTEFNVAGIITKFNGVSLPIKDFQKTCEKLKKFAKSQNLIFERVSRETGDIIFRFEELK